jgi:DNA-directed RNA polymerase specialized sigma24 family protein
MGHASTSRTQGAAREPNTFARFYEAEVVRQMRGATLMLGSQQAAQDIVHDVFAEIFQRWDGGIFDPGPYLQRAVVNRCRADEWDTLYG